jgi:hypothetical protein
VGLRSRRLHVFAAAVFAVATAATMAGAWPAAASPVVRAAATAAVSKAQSRSELLINGDRLEVTGTASPSVAVAPAGSGFAASVIELHLAGKTYAIPAAAFPYLGRGLDLGLFDVTALPPGGILPVRIAYHGATPKLPGITIIRAAGGIAQGYLTASSAKAFGAALARQLASDHAKASYGTDGLFAHGVAIGLVGSVQVPAPRPLFPMHPLTVHGITLAGTPDTGDIVFVFNADNNAFFGDPNEAGNIFDGGTAKFSVPSGHYLAFGDFVDFDAHGNPVSERVVLVPRFTVSGSGAASVGVDERAATSQVTVVTPRPAVTSNLSWELRNADGAGHVNIFGWQESSNFPLWVSPTTQSPAAGTLQVFTSARLVSPATAKSPYTYDLAFQDLSGLIAPQHYTAYPASLATVHARYFSGVRSAGGLLRVGLFPAQVQDGYFAAINQLNVPVRQREYLTAGTPAVDWISQYWQTYNTVSGGQSDATRTFSPGQDAHLDWNAYPLHTALNVNLLGTANPSPTLLSASRSADTLSLDVTPFSDSTPGHTGSGLFPGLGGNSGTISGSYEIDQNGTKIAAGDATKTTSPFGDFFTQVKLSPNPSVLRFVLAGSRTGAPYPLSTATKTVWTWNSRHKAGVTIPNGWICLDGSQSCGAEPLLSLDYAVAGLGLSGTAPAGVQVVRVEAGHQQLAAAPKITSITVQVSFDDGATWQPAQVVGSGKTRYAVFSAPPGSYVTLKVTAADAAGSTISETITRGYATAATAASAGYKAACATPAAGHARCFALYSSQSASSRARAAGFAAAVAAPAGWGAKDIESAYKLPIATNPHQTVAVVDAYDTPNLESYLNTYRKEYGLPPCTTANGCFRKVNQNGKAAPLPADGTLSGWDLETTLDVDMVSAACPNCRILVVESNSASFADLATAENAAAKLGAAVISNSYGTRENGFTQAYAGAYNHPGHTIMVSSGDYGYTAASFPANLATVTAAGGTQLSKAPNGRGWSEQVWNTPGAGAASSGCSAYVTKPAWQHDPDCPGRTVADVSALAWDIAVYNKDYGGWIEGGGTSASSPLIAGVYGLAGNAAKVKPGYEYAHAGSLYDITSGNNDWFYADGGGACGHDYLCTAKKGYDAPTGLGSPHGTGAF